MKVWIISDTHFGHERMHELCGRPQGFEDKILSAVSKIPTGDTIVHLGDFCIGRDEYWHQKWLMATQYTTRVLVRGNHDSKSQTWYMRSGWHFACDSFSLNTFGKRILFTHVPQVYDTDLYDTNIHGHLHNTGHHPNPHDDSRDYRLVAMETENYQPVLLKNLII
jgi:calcineurin-like phosphoesterase family protein